MHARSSVKVLSHPIFKATWVALAAGSVAALAVLGACSRDSSKITGTLPLPASPRFHLEVGGHAHEVEVCSSASSTGGPITVTVAQVGGLLETNAVDPDRINTYQYNFGPYTTPDVITSSVTISPNECKTVFERNNTCVAPADCSNRLNHQGNRLWTNESNTSSPPPGGSGTPPQGAVSVPWPNIPQIYNGIVNPYVSVSITATIPNGYQLVSLTCTNDDPALPQTVVTPAVPDDPNTPADEEAPAICSNGGRSSANAFNGSSFTYTITGSVTNPCVLPNAAFGLGAANAFTLLGLAGNHIDVESGAILIQGDAGFGPNNTGVAKKATIDGDLTNDPTSTVNVSADLNVTGSIFNASLATASADATSASAALDALVANETIGSITGNQSFTTAGGTKVIDIASVSVGRKTFTITGDADDIFIFNVAGGFSFRGSQMILSGGVRPSNIIWNFTGTTGDVLIKESSPRAFGVFLAPDRNFYGDKATLVGALLVGQDILLLRTTQLLCEET